MCAEAGGSMWTSAPFGRAIELKSNIRPSAAGVLGDPTYTYSQRL